jgi:hypothetical protein
VCLVVPIKKIGAEEDQDDAAGRTLNQASLGRD